MTRKIDQLVVSDEELADAAETFVIADLKRRAARANRNKLLQESTCFRRGSDENIKNCFDALRHDQIISKSELCENCREIDVETQAVRRASAQRNGKLRRLRGLVKRRLENRLERSKDDAVEL